MRIDSNRPFAILLTVFFCIWSWAASANDQDAKAIAKLNKQISTVKTIRSTLERRDAARATLLLDASTHVVATIETFHLGHAKTFNAFASMKITYLSSRLFLGTVTSDFTAPLIEELYSITGELLADAGLDDDWPVKQVAAMFENIKRRADLMRTGRISDALRESLVELNGHIGTAIAVGQAEGDRPPSFEAGNKAYCAIVKLAPMFESIPANWPEFDEGVMVRAVAALYAEYAKTSPESCQ